MSRVCPLLQRLLLNHDRLTTLVDTGDALIGGVIFLDRGSAMQFFVAIFVSLVFLVIDTFVRPYHDFRCNALKVLTSMSMLITLLCGFASKLDPKEEVVSDATLGWTLIVSRLRVFWRHNCVLIHAIDQIANFIIVILTLSLELLRRLLSIYRGVRSGIAYVEDTQTVCPATGVTSYEGEFRQSAEDKALVSMVKAYPLHTHPDVRLVHS